MSALFVEGRPGISLDGTNPKLGSGERTQEIDLGVARLLTASPQIIEFENQQSNFTNELFRYLHEQAGLAENGRGKHPDSAICVFNRGLYDFLKTLTGQRLRDLLFDIYLRTGKKPDHLVDLIARVTQFLFRKNNDDSYIDLKPTEEEGSGMPSWSAYWQKLGDDDYDQIQQLLEEKQVSTHVLTRYRALAALAQLIENQTNALSIVDLGCSCNLGLAGLMRPKQWLPQLKEDDTPNGIISNLPENNFPNDATWCGVDLAIVSDEWAKACAYFRQYESEHTQMTEARALVSSHEVSTSTLSGDITESDLWQQIDLLTDSRPVDIVHASMVLYQLGPEQVQQCLDLACQRLVIGGCFVELTFINQDSWFANTGGNHNDRWEATIQSTVRFKTNDGRLTEPYQWLLWDKSRCEKVRPGKDYDVVMHALVNRRQSIGANS